MSANRDWKLDGLTLKFFAPIFFGIVVAMFGGFIAGAAVVYQAMKQYV